MATGFCDDDSHPDQPDERDEDERYRLKPELFPRSLELKLSPQALLALQELSKRSGRSMGEIAEEIISKNLDAPSED